MIKLISTLAILMSVGAFAQAATNSVNLTVAPVGIAVDSTQLGAEVVVARNLTLGARYANVDTDFRDVQAEGESYGIIGRFHMTRDALNGGLYLSPAVDFPNYNLQASIDGERGTATLNDPIYSALIGYQWMWEHFNVNLAGGVSHLSGLESVRIARADGTTDTVDVPALLPAAELTLGWAF